MDTRLILLAFVEVLDLDLESALSRGDRCSSTVKKQCART